MAASYAPTVAGTLFVTQQGESPMFGAYGKALASTVRHPGRSVSLSYGGGTSVQSKYVCLTTL